MELSLIISIITLIVVIVVAFLVFSNKSKDTATLDPEKFETNSKELLDKIDELKTKFMTDISTAQNNINTVIGNLGSTVGQTKGELQTKNDQILQAQQNLLDALTGSKKTGIAGELLLQNLLDQSGLVKGQQWIQNQNYKKDGSTLHVEFAIVHPSKLVMPVDSHWGSQSAIIAGFANFCLPDQMIREHQCQILIWIFHTIDEKKYLIY